MDATTLIDALEDADLETFPYTGRGMYGQGPCVAVRLDRTTPFKVGAGLALTLGNAVSTLRVETDSLGRDTVLYFPKIEWPEDEA